MCSLFLMVLNSADGMAQANEALMRIIDGQGGKDVTQRKIDSFFTAKNAKGISKIELADCYHDLGLRWHYRNWLQRGLSKDLKGAIHFTEMATSLKRNLDSLPNCSLNKTLYNLAVYKSEDGQINEGINLYRDIISKGQTYCRDSEGDDKVQAAREALGKLYMMLGEFFQALDIYQELIDAFHRDVRDKDRDPTKIVWAHIRSATIYASMNSLRYPAEIMDNLRRARTLVEETGLTCCFFQNRIDQLEADYFFDQKQYAQALPYYRRILDRLPSGDSINQGVILNNIGFTHLRLGEDRRARESFEESIRLWPDYTDPYNNLGDYFVKKENFEEAIRHYQQAINLAISSQADTPPLQLPLLEDLKPVPQKIPLLNHIVTKANGWLSYYEHDGNPSHLEKALETFTLADQLVDLIRFESVEHRSQLFWREQGSDLYLKAVEVCHLLGRPEQAFNFMERNKALLLLEDLGQEQAKEVAGLPQELAEREFRLRRAIPLAENRLQQANDGDPLQDSLYQAVDQAKYGYRQFVDSLEADYPKYAEYRRGIQVLDFEGMKERYTSHDQAMLHYILDDERGYGLLTTRDTVSLFPLDDVPHLNSEAERLVSMLADFRSDRDSLQRASHSLFRKLMPDPIFKTVKGKRVTLVPDYTLQRIPFDALVTDIDRGAYLIEEVELSYAYSASLLNRVGRAEPPENSEWVGFAPVQFAGSGLPELFFSTRELQGISEVFPGKSLLSGQATKANFLRETGEHGIFHLATHAGLGEADNPWVAFRDDRMYLKEIYATRNPAEMVVLSACNTSDGTIKRGEGVMSLARGFFYAGARSVVSSLWAVNDESGPKILIAFYDHLHQGASKSEALRDSKLEYLESVDAPELKHPYYWAGFIVLGDVVPISKANDWTKALWLLLPLGVGIWWYRRRSLKAA